MIKYWLWHLYRSTLLNRTVNEPNIGHDSKTQSHYTWYRDLKRSIIVVYTFFLLQSLFDSEVWLAVRLFQIRWCRETDPRTVFQHHSCTRNSCVSKTLILLVPKNVSILPSHDASIDWEIFCGMRVKIGFLIGERAQKRGIFRREPRRHENILKIFRNRIAHRVWRLRSRNFVANDWLDLVFANLETIKAKLVLFEFGGWCNCGR